MKSHGLILKDIFLFSEKFLDLIRLDSLEYWEFETEFKIDKEDSIDK